MEGIFDGISKYIQPKETFPKYTYEELMAMPYEALYALHSKFTEQRLGKNYGEQMAFGNLTIDAAPNKSGEANLHFAPLPGSQQNKDDLNYTATPTETLKLSLIGLEDLINLIKHYSTPESGDRLRTLNGTTTMAMAEIAAKMGFSYARMRRQDSGEGFMRSVTASLEKLSANIPHYEETLKRLESLAKKKGITPSSIRAEIIAART